MSANLCRKVYKFNEGNTFIVCKITWKPQENVHLFLALISTAIIKRTVKFLMGKYMEANYKYS
jgi:hypothetical protein